LTETLGKPEDDAFNTFTPRLLLLLESYPLLEELIHSNVISEVISAYWRDYEGHSDKLIPTFLANDILRLWRTFCVNYEARTERQPEQKRWKRKTKNYKLEFSRLLTCYSALLYLLFTFSENGTVHPEDVVDMVGLSPTERIENLCDISNSEEVKNCLKNLLDKYNNFLKVTDVPEDDLIKQFGNKDVSDKHFEEAKNFGTSVFEALNLIGINNEFHRLLVV
jgi:hypothetical protein